MKSWRIHEGSSHCITLTPLLTATSAVLLVIAYIHIPLSSQRRERCPLSLVKTLIWWRTPRAILREMPHSFRPPQLSVHTIMFAQVPPAASPCSTPSRLMAMLVWYPGSNITPRIWSNRLGGYFQGLLLKRRCLKPSEDPEKNEWRTHGTRNTCVKFF